MQPPVPSFTTTWHNAPYPSISPTRPELSAAGKTVIVTGAGSGIGHATTASFARAGATKIILIGRNKVNLEETQRSLPCASSVHAVDVRDEQAVPNVASAVGRWDMLILAAGYIPTPASILDSSVNEWLEALETNLKGTLILAKSFLPPTNPIHAAVIGYSAAVTFPAAMLPGLSAYTISKTAVIKLIEYTAAENPSIFAAALHPGVVDTPILRKTGVDPTTLPMDDADLPANFAVWLASKEASFLKGG
ncbi:putative NADP(+)-dependent dehydrogenase [Aspergillus keveii]|uniref:NADP(+)-dependent dehydrogenase n=1 Tax=Aspergillus keveii TaxID=714993 RepID=A0ABR4G8W4_9EURO